MTIDERINAFLAPIADWLGKVVFFSVPVAGAQLPLIVVWLIMAGVVCTLAFRFVNLRGFRHSARVIRGDYSSRAHAGEASPFQALSTAVSGTVGLGSIGGVAVAVTLGGPGATLWMMLAGFLGMSLKFAEVTLSVKYRRVRPDGTVTGGAMYYVPEALGTRRLAAARKIPGRVFLRRRDRRLGHDIPGEPGVCAGARGHGVRPGVPVRAPHRGLDRHRAVRRREAHRLLD
jgi:AGCS family alanine or glycine:cation symporter